MLSTNSDAMTTSNAETWQVVSVQSRHLDGIRALFRKVFGNELSPAHWHWKYGKGRGHGVVVLEDQDVVAFFGGTERRVIFDGYPLVAIQCGDSMVEPGRRGVLTRKGPFYLSVTAFLGKWVGDGLPYLLTYGFPNERAMRLAERLDLYAEVGTMLQLKWQPEPGSNCRAEDLDFSDSRHQQLINKLWLQMADEFSNRAIGVRDFNYIKQRFQENPTLDYKFDLVFNPDSSSPLGLLVTRKTEKDLLLVDIVARAEQFDTLVNFARHRAFSVGAGKLYGWLTDVDYPLVESTAPDTDDDPLRLPLGVYSPGLRAEDVRDKWFFMCGDSDFL